MAEELKNVESVGRPRNILLRSATHSNLMKFKEAKHELQKIFGEIERYVGECRSFFEQKLPKDAGQRLSPTLAAKSDTELQPYMDKVQHIREIIARNQMKCAFFGRTSNGKSTVINAMLGSRILPSGIGQTTSCFVQVEGTSQNTGFLQQEAPRESVSSEEAEIKVDPQPMESVGQLAHALSSAKLATDTLIYLYWPSSSCHLLREDVVFLDSPGVNVDPDIDAWIDRHCLDADVFILVANAESTLMQAEKDFFYRVSNRISKPNIFILNNRWDASAGEAELIDQVKEQHMQRCVSFLTDELKVCGREEATERVFFVSAREVLTIRSKSVNGGSPPPGAAPNIGSPSAGGYPLAEGWQARLMEFSTFEKVFEKIISDSATKTKFASHAEQGKELAAFFRHLMESTYEAALEEKDAAIRYHRLSQSRFDEVRVKQGKAAENIGELISRCLRDVEDQVGNALCTEIRRLGELVDSFSGQAFSANNEADIRTYKNHLNAFIERELGRKLSEACAGDIRSQVLRAEQIMANIYCGMVTTEASKTRIMQGVLSSAFEPEFHVDCRNICAEFREDLRFRFSLGLSSLAERLLHHQRISVTQNLTAWSSAPGVPEYSPVIPAVLSAMPSLMGRNAVGGILLAGIALKATGWRVIMICVGVYAGMYAYERLAWTNRARENVFKSQYVEYASHKLRLIVDLTGTNARHQVKRELQQMQKRLCGEGEDAANALQTELHQLDSDIVTLDDITTSAKKLKNSAVYLDGCLDSFGKEYISTA